MIPGATTVLKAVGGRAGVLAILLAMFLLAFMSFAVRAAIDTMEQQARKITQLETDLKTEQTLRQSDVSGLTALIDGMAVLQEQNDLDQGAVKHALDTAKPQPVSPFMRAFYECLRSQRETGKACAAAALNASKASGAK
jgi:hypothetical protein